MLTGLKLGNFKAFGDTQNIPIKPLTLIYGANSAGKSSIIHGLLLACHANETGNVDAHQTRLGGDSVNLGGFRQYVHRRNDLLPTALGADFYFNKIVDNFDAPDVFIKDVKFRVQVNFIISITDSKSGSPKINSCEVYLDDNKFLCLTRHAGKHFKLAELNLQHSAFKHVLAPIVNTYFTELIRDSEDNVIDGIEVKDEMLSTEDLSLEQCSRCVEDLKLHLEFSSGMTIPDELTYNWAEMHRWLKGLLFPRTLSGLPIVDTDIYIDHEDGRGSTQVAYDLIKSRIVDVLLPRSSTEVSATPCLKEMSEALANLLTQVQYLGPLRSYPPRQIASPNDYDQDWYASGGYAWEVVRRDAKVRKAVNLWLGSERLQTQYELTVRRYVYSDPICQDNFLPCLRWVTCPLILPTFQPTPSVT